MTHERCSELLSAYAAGDLPRGDAEAVRAHLEACAECRAEQRAAAAFAAPPGEGLSDLERARLHRALAQELFVSRANAEVAATPSEPPWKRWILPALGSAAAVLIALLVITGGLVGGGDDQASIGTEGDAGGSDASLETAQEATTDTAAGGGAGGGGEPHSSDDRALSATSGGPAAAFDSEGPRPEFEPDAGRLSAEELASIGRSSELFQAFSNRYTVGDVGVLRERFLRRLVASSGAASDQARRCAATLPQDEPILPAYGATGTYDGRDALVLGFVTNDAGSAALDRYLMWVWAKGSCRQPVDTLFERIDR
ncbi:MAG: zf-HC2 domain-containing protein [Actinomycetota bacterium]|nr:zf-HC2 domain-containing protein [Actinomycetota bacterium]